MFYRMLVETNMFQGSKIRASYITFAQKEKKRLEAVIETSGQGIAVQEKEVERLKGMNF